MGQDCYPVSSVTFPKAFANMFCRNFVREFMHNSECLDSVCFVWLGKLIQGFFFFLSGEVLSFPQTTAMWCCSYQPLNKDRVKKKKRKLCYISTFNKQVVSFTGVAQAPYFQQEEFTLVWLFVSVGGYDRLISTVPDSHHPHDLPVKAIAKVFLLGRGMHV